MRHTWYGGHWNTIKWDPARPLTEELLTGPVPKSTASYTLKYKVQHFSLKLGSKKYAQVQPHSQGCGEPVGVKQWPSPEDAGAVPQTDHSPKRWFHCWHFVLAVLKVHYHLTSFHFLKLPPCLQFCPAWLLPCGSAVERVACVLLIWDWGQPVYCPKVYSVGILIRA